jgi:AbiV family abortive infection protein
MNVALRNARRLVADAKTLLEAGRYPSAAALAALSIEESGKLTILRSMAVARDAQEVAQTWKSYRSHQQKNVAWILPQLVSQGARQLDDFRPLFKRDAEHPYLLDQLKQLGFYTDCLGKAHWSEPDAVIDQKLSQQLVQVAEILSKGREVSTREIELWLKHVKPVWCGPTEWMKTAVANWYADMQREGLLPEGRNEMEEFLWHGLDKGQTSDNSEPSV